ncbi:site-specific integrase [Shewanella algae]|uniref:site-specific integrase n=1 Tax=Shewanella algae TaxID=38313 RepID=UPI001AAF7E08|nr:site-specific integrase [Shewanella algae]EKT4489477.1 site-specific integrase [Shewanella algae]MBO2546230.1 site-specific integrase [Shewanella algae]
MENPLILPMEQKSLVRLLGHQSRTAIRQKNYTQTIKQALAVLESYLPELFEVEPKCDRFAEIWPQVDSALRQVLKSETSYRRGYSFICQQLETGNRQGLWQINPPADHLTLRRARPLRSLAWQLRTSRFASKAFGWLDTLNQTSDPQQCFARLLMSCICYGGLNKPALWPALAKALTEEKPLRGNKDLCWLTLRPKPAKDFPSNLYTDHGGLGPNKAQVEVQFFPDPISFGVIKQFLNCRSNSWRYPKSIKTCVEIIKSELKIEIPLSQLRQGGICFAEMQHNIELPQVLVEFALGRQKSASLPNAYWLRLFKSTTGSCDINSFAKFKQWYGQKRTDISTVLAPRSPRQGNRYLLNQIREILKRDTAKNQVKSHVVRKLKALANANLRPNEEILIQWLLHHLTCLENEVSTADRYFAEIGGTWLAATADVDLYSLSCEDFFELYQEILNRTNSQQTQHYKACRFQDLHTFAHQNFDLPPLYQPLSEGSDINPHVSAAIVDEPLFLALLRQIDYLEDINFTAKRMLKCFLIIAYRTGLRPGEVAKLRLKDIEPSSVGWLFVRESRHGHNKTESALRKVPLFPLLTDHEKALVEGHLRERLLTCHNRYAELLIHTEGNPFEVVNTRQISWMVKEMLSQLSGGIYYRLYHLRHTALSRMQLLAHDDLIALPEVIQALLPYTPSQRKVITKLIFGEGRLRDRYFALAVFAGHSTPDTTLRSYLHFTDLLLGIHLGANSQEIPAETAKMVLGVSPYRYKKMRKSGPITPLRLLPFLRKRLVPFINPVNSIRQSTATQNNVVEKSSHYIQALAVLSRIERDHDYQEVAVHYRLPSELTERWRDAALALRSLKTPRGIGRLFSTRRAGALLPAEPTSIYDRKDIQSALNTCSKIKGSREGKIELRWAIQYCLTHSTSSHTWIYFDNADEFQRFMRFVSQLFPWQRWHLRLRSQFGQPTTRWRPHHHLEITRYTLTKAGEYPDGVGLLFLRHANEQQYIKSRGGAKISQYCSPALQTLFHRLAIILFNAEQIRKWERP